MLRLYQWLDSSHDGADAGAGDTRVPTELRYDWLFEASSESVIIADAASGTVVEANPAAAGLLQSTRAGLIGAPLASMFHAASSVILRERLDAATEAKSTTRFIVRAAHGEADLGAQVSLFRSMTKSYFLVRLTSYHQLADKHPLGSESLVLQAIDEASVGFLMSDGDFCIDYANHAFIEMVALASREHARGTSVLRWLALSAEDLSRLRLQVCEREAVTLLTTRLRSHRAGGRKVQVCAVAVPAGHETCWAFSVCEMPRLN